MNKTKKVSKVKEWIDTSLCDFQYLSTCQGKCLSYKRYGKAGRDRGKLVELVCACSTHTTAALNTDVMTGYELVLNSKEEE